MNQRLIFALLAQWVLLNSYNNRICLNVAITSMVVPLKPSNCSDNGFYSEDEGDIHDAPESYGEFKWSQSLQGIILSSFFLGYTISHIPGAILIDRFGGKRVLSFCSFIMSTLSLLIPVTVTYGGHQVLIAIRVIQGLSDGVTYPALNVMMTDWIPPIQRNTLGTLILSGNLIGSVIANAGTGFLIALSSRWDVPFYVFGCVAYVWNVLWTFCVFDKPIQHPHISQTEIQSISESMGGAERSEIVPSLPWKPMLTSGPLWGLINAQVGHAWGYYIMSTNLPKYMNDILKFPVHYNGMIAAAGWMAMWVSAQISGRVLKIWMERGTITKDNARKLACSASSIVPGIFLLLASYADYNRVLVVMCFILCLASMGPYYPGVRINCLDLSPNYAGYIMALVNGIGAFVGMTTPLLIGFLTPNASVSEWRLVFWITFVVFLVTSVVYYILASADIQWWNEGDIQDSDSEDPHSSEKVNKDNSMY